MSTQGCSIIFITLTPPAALTSDVPEFLTLDITKRTSTGLKELMMRANTLIYSWIFGDSLKTVQFHHR